MGKWPNPNQYLVAPLDPAAPVRSYCPFTPEHSALFREFAQSPLSPSDALALANRYGLLHRLSNSPLGEGDGLLAEANIREAYAGLSPDQQAPIKAAYDSFEWGKNWPNLQVDFEPLENWRDLITSLRPVVKLTAVRSIEIRDFRLGGVGARINKHLAAEAVGHRLFWHHGRLVEGPVPLHLAGAIWLQVAFSVVRHVEYRTCANAACRRPFEVAAGLTTGKRANATFCSDRCKSQDYRDRKALAKTLKAQGVPLRSIARR